MDVALQIVGGIWLVLIGIIITILMVFAGVWLFIRAVDVVAKELGKPLGAINSGKRVKEIETRKDP